jgi:hypothetical protein
LWHREAVTGLDPNEFGFDYADFTRERDFVGGQRAPGGRDTQSFFLCPGDSFWQKEWKSGLEIHMRVTPAP